MREEDMEIRGQLLRHTHMGVRIHSFYKAGARKAKPQALHQMFSEALGQDRVDPIKCFYVTANYFLAIFETTPPIVRPLPPELLKELEALESEP